MTNKTVTENKEDEDQKENNKNRSLARQIAS